MTTHVNPADGGDACDYYKRYCLLMGELEAMAELSESSTAFRCLDAIRMSVFYQGLLGLLDQAWKIESFEHGEIPQASLLGQVLSYGRECFREHAQLNETRSEARGQDPSLNNASAAEEMVYLLDKALQLEPHLSPDAGSEQAVQDLGNKLPSLLEGAREHLEWSKQIVERERGEA